MLMRYAEKYMYSVLSVLSWIGLSLFSVNCSGLGQWGLPCNSSSRYRFYFSTSKKVYYVTNNFSDILVTLTEREGERDNEGGGVAENIVDTWVQEF